MCLAIPARIAQLESDGIAVVEIGGVRKRVSIELIDSPQIDEYVIVHVGYALARIDAAEAQRTLALMADTGILADAAARAEMAS